MKIHLLFYILFFSALALTSCSTHKHAESPQKKDFSGIYPHLAYYNNEGECGTGAVVPWAGKLWVITYAPHKPEGSTDKLYEISPDLEQTIYPQSIGGTPANRMIHQETNQLCIGPYVISDKGEVRAIPYSKMPGRHTGNARHLTDPDHMIYYATMEEGFYEVNLNTLEVNTIYQDANAMQKKGDMSQHSPLLPGAHGKGLYSGQGVLVYSNNGEANKEALHNFKAESGALMEWDGKKWKLIRRNQFVEVTGPGGIYGNKNPETDPIWATGWDYKSVILGVRYNGTWSFYRLPKASHSYDGGHGWNTEWPRIRNIGTADHPDNMMTMHGMFWHFPQYFTPENSAGIRPRSAYLKVIGDFARWGEKLVFGCDDSAQKEFLNKRKAKGTIEGPGQSNSNVWFTDIDKPDKLGPATANGAIWLDEDVKKDSPSEPFLFSGWDQKWIWIQNKGQEKVEFHFETDKTGNNNWATQTKVIVGPNATKTLHFAKNTQAEWIRATINKGSKVSVHFSFTNNDYRGTEPDAIFQGLSTISDSKSKGGLLYALGDNKRKLGVLAHEFSNDNASETGYYELDAEMNLNKVEDKEMSSFIRTRFAIPKQVIEIEESSVLVIDDNKRRWRLPLGNEKYTRKTNDGLLRICREVATERDLFHCMGTFYELPAENADGYAKIRPVSKHNYRIHDYASYRGLLIMTGIAPDQQSTGHIILSDDGKAAVWAGVIDDLWKLGKPRGKGGPWKNSSVKANIPSDPYLIGFYDKKHLSLSHKNEKSVHFTIETDPSGHGPWMVYKEIDVEPGETFEFDFPEGFQSRWIRFTSDDNCIATAWLEYK